jgi:hypothetical protein
MSVKHRFAVAIAASAMVALAGCGTPFAQYNPWGGVREQSRIPADATAYTCNGGKTLYVRYGPSAQYAMLLYPDREFRLDSQGGPAATRFSNGRTVMSLNGDELRVEEGGNAVYSGCKKVDASR